MDDIDKLFDCFTSEAPEESETISAEPEPGELTEKTTPERKKRKLDADEEVEQKKSKLNDDSVPETLEPAKTSEMPDVSVPTKEPKEEMPEEMIDEATDDAMKHKAKVELNLDDLGSKKFSARIDVHKIEAPESCFHEVAVHPGGEFIPLTANTGEPAKKYAFVLDSFQKESILCIDNNQSVLVSAHTSAGKTVVAEYAIAVSLKNKQRVIYTTPIKALSNQKYREFSTEFKDVGLVTGDVTINPSASCLIMTTEILRNMLYRGSEIMREVGWVVFDEIHYMRDKERGVVWEETLILLPHNVRFVFLSATIPNARQFAEWVCYLHQQPCHVVYTDYRPTPLQHFIFPAGGTGIHMVVDETGAFKEENFNAAMAVLQNAGEAAKGDQKGRKGGVRGQNPATTNIFKIVKMIMERNFAPVIVFSFSKKDCELYAMQMAKLDFNSASEKLLVDEVFQNAMAILSEADRNLPQVLNLLPLLRRGIGIHHGGLLPILKETIEILFGEGLIKALFATETFAMGLNMPARTVLFTGSRKFDGTDMRWITSGEYIQMSGRAGRRGIDDKGIVILMIDEKVPAAIGREIVKGQPDPINSAFHLTYNMVLNLLRVEEVNPEYMLERSFYQFQNQLALPDLHADYVKLIDEYNAIEIINEEEVSTYYSIRQQLNTLGVQFQGYLTKPQYLVPFLQPGRLVKIKYEKDEYDWGIILSFKKVADKNKKGQPANPTTTESKVMVDILLNVSEGDNDKSRTIPNPGPLNKPGLVTAVPVASQYITTISSVRVKFPEDLRPPENRLSVYKTISEVKKRFQQGPPLLNPIKDMNIKDPEFRDICQRIEKLEKRMFAHSLHNSPTLDTEYPKYEKKTEIDAQVKVAKQKFLEAKSVLQLDELKSRKRVLRRMNYCSNTDVIALKGRVACELSSADELLLTELIFNGTFGQLNPSQCAALLSCFVCDEKSNDSMKLAEELSGSLRTMQDLARRIAKVSVEARLQIDEETYVDRFKPHLMDVVHSWCNGVTFAELCNMTDIFEGSIIRCMRRLEELLRQMCQAAKTIGNSELEDKFSMAIKLLKRDIIFAASLYL